MGFTITFKGTANIETEDIDKATDIFFKSLEKLHDDFDFEIDIKDVVS